MDTLKQISDGSLEDVEFPGLSPDIKQESEDYEMPENCLEVDMDIENSTTKTMSPGKKKGGAKKKHMCIICNKNFKDNYKLKRHENIHIKGGLISESTFQLSPK